MTADQLEKIPFEVKKTNVVDELAYEPMDDFHKKEKEDIEFYKWLISTIEPELINLLKAEQISHLTAEQLSHLTAEQLSKVPYEVIEIVYKLRKNKKSK